MKIIVQLQVFITIEVQNDHLIKGYEEILLLNINFDKYNVIIKYDQLNWILKTEIWLCLRDVTTMIQPRT